VIDFSPLVSDDGTLGSGCDINGIAKDDQDAYKRETVLLLKYLPTLRQVKEARSLVSATCLPITIYPRTLPQHKQEA
jgi:hypothetical protein